MRAGSQAVTATIISSDPKVGRLVTSSTSGSEVVVQIAPGSERLPSSVAAGGVAFEPLTADNTNVSATIPGIISTTAAAVDVTVTSTSP